MFTGIVEHVGEVIALSPSGAGTQLRVRVGPLAHGLARGGSVAVSGVCLTATLIDDDEVVFDAGEETMRVTTLASFRSGTRVNLERPLTPEKPLGGHFVQGHVDGVGSIAGSSQRAGGWLIEFGAPDELTAQMAPKGSVAVDGVSLTVVDLSDGRFTVFVIPHTFEHTTLGLRRAGDAVNIETDIIGKYVARYLGGTGPAGLTEEKLRDLGYA